jgi:hypothetical protein
MLALLERPPPTLAAARADADDVFDVTAASVWDKEICGAAAEREV